MLHKFFSFIKKNTNKDLNEIYLSLFIRSLAESMIGIFIPIYFLEKGFSLNTIWMYYLILFISVILILPLFLYFNNFGIKKVMIFGTLILVLTYWYIQFVETDKQLIMLGLIEGIGIGAYYAGFNILFANKTDDEKEGIQVAIENSIYIVSSIIGPILGAMLISFLSFNTTFIITMIVLCFSIIPLIFSKETYCNGISGIKKIISAEKPNTKIVFSIQGSLGLISGIIWPIFIYLNIKNIISVGAIISITSIILILTTLIIGKLSDKNLKKTFIFGTITHAISWPIKFLLISPMGLFISNIISGITSSAVDIPVAKLTYANSKKSKNIADYFMLKELCLSIGRVIVLILAIIVTDFYSLFILGFIITMGYLLILKEI